MAEDKYENTLLPQPDLDIETGYIRTLDKNGVSYKDDMTNVAAAFIVDYNRSLLGGIQRSVATAFNDVTGDIASINDRICTSNELTTLEQMLGINSEGGE